MKIITITGLAICLFCLIWSIFGLRENITQLSLVPLSFGSAIGIGYFGYKITEW